MENNFTPYIGPRYFEQKDKDLFFGRDYETRELCSRIIAHNVVLFYAQSGAGKTSLINAGVIPRLLTEEFEILPVARVSGQIPKELNPNNIYIFNALLNWSSNDIHPEVLASVSMRDFIKNRHNRSDIPLLIILDQFEELFTHYQERWTERKNFFEQVVETLERNPTLRVVFVMREDFIAYLDPYIALFPNKLNVRLRLERMKKDAAIAAVIGPVQKTEKKYADGVAEYIVDELLKVKVNTATGETIVIPGEYIEPVQLQVVCQNLWAHLPEGINVITKEHVQKVGSVDDALREFYDHAVSSITGSEKEIRTWFETQLITSTGTRGTVFRGPKETGGIKNEFVDDLQKKYIIRGEWRAGGQWFELTHDSLIKAVQDSNRSFNERVKSLAEQYHQRGIIHFNSKEYNKAIIEFDKAIQMDDQFKWAYENKSLALNILGQNKEALAVINKALEIDPSDAWAYSQRGKIYNDVNEYGKAIIDLDKAIELDFNENWTFANKSYALNEQGQNEKALKAINRALEIDPDYGWAYSQRGKIYNDLKEYEKALTDLDKAIDLGFAENWTYGNKAFALNESGENDRALEQINKALEIDPEYAWAYALRGKIYNDMDQYNKALYDLDKSIKSGFHENWVYGNKSYALNELNRNKEALEAINKALEIDPDYVWGYGRRGKIYIDTGEYEKAAADLDIATELSSKDKWNHANKALALNELGQNDKALESINKALNLDPNYGWAYAERGKIYNDMKDYKKALADVSKAIELGCKETWVYGNKSYALDNMGQSKKALEAIDKALEMDPNYAWALDQRVKITEHLTKNQK